VRPTRLNECCHRWVHKGCLAAICWPIRIPVCMTDYLCRCCLICCADGSTKDATNNHPNDRGWCTACIFDYFPLCMPDIWMSTNSTGGLGVFCADNQCRDGTRCGAFWCCVACPFCIVSRTAVDRWKHLLYRSNGPTASADDSPPDRQNNDQHAQTEPPINPAYAPPFPPARVAPFSPRARAAPLPPPSPRIYSSRRM
jgi:hypothetical protein